MNAAARETARIEADADRFRILREQLLASLAELTDEERAQAARVAATFGEHPRIVRRLDPPD